MESDGRDTPERPTTNNATFVSETSAETHTVSCTKYFDALWFCYSPVHQLKRYYVHGDVDDCVAHWGTLMACLKQKTRFRLDDEEEALPAQPSMWEIRSPEEARDFWSGEFPDGNGSADAGPDAYNTGNAKNPMA